MNMTSRTRRLAVIGYGSITNEIVTCLERRGEIDVLAGVLVRHGRATQLRGKAANRFAVVDSLDALLGLNPDAVIEAAGHSAVASLAAPTLARGHQLIIASVGALADRALARAIAAAAVEQAELWIPSGAVAGIDGLLASRTAGLQSVTYTSLKTPVAWKGTPAEELLDASASSKRVIFFSGTAREAAALYPQNANVGATIALASLGLDRTQVRLGADPLLDGPCGLIEAEGDFGRFRFETTALAAPSNPKTSLITGHSLVAAALDGMCFRALPLLRAA